MQEIEVRPDELEVLEAEDYVLPLAEITDLSEAPYTLIMNGVEYSYSRSVPIKGHGATIPLMVDEWLGEGRDVLVARRGDRYYLYLTPPQAPAATQSS